jgi:hypothetical protein
MMWNTLAITLLVASIGVDAFSSPPRLATVNSPSATNSFALYAMKKRKRKQPPSDAGVGATSTSPPLSSRELVNNTTQAGTLSVDELALMNDVANFEFKPEAFISMGMYYKSLLA